jgi:pyridinium-3,5-bisthiocarboxylic acid mononucleotide nickel chelatase
VTVLYFDCFGGAAGDMIVAALLDAGAPIEVIMESLDALEVDGWALDVTVSMDSGLRATRVGVVESGKAPPRSYANIVELLDKASLPTGVRQRALDAFRKLGEAEAKVHGSTLADVHFHEVGSTDAIVDIVAASAALEFFAPQRVVVSPIPTGRGFVESAHGTLPLPAPAVVEILKDAILLERGHWETITPTGAALLAAAASEYGEMPPLRIQSSGYGAGTRQHEIPNVLRVIVGDEAPVTDDARSGDLVLETNIDDMAPELLPHVIESLLGAGAHDAWISPVVMKKGRPGFVVSALTPAIHKFHLLEILYRETTTLGVRFYPVERATLERKWIEVEVEGHPMRVKLGIKSGDVVTASPEYDDALRVARETGLPLKDVYAAATHAAREEIELA